LPSVQVISEIIEELVQNQWRIQITSYPAC